MEYYKQQWLSNYEKWIEEIIDKNKKGDAISHYNWEERLTGIISFEEIISDYDKFVYIIYCLHELGHPEKEFSLAGLEVDAYDLLVHSVQESETVNKEVRRLVEDCTSFNELITVVVHNINY